MAEVRVASYGIEIAHLKALEAYLQEIKNAVLKPMDPRQRQRQRGSEGRKLDIRLEVLHDLTSEFLCPGK